MHLVSGRTSVTVALKMGPLLYTASENLATDQGPTCYNIYKHKRKYATTIGYGIFVWNLSKVNSWHINFYCKKVVTSGSGIRAFECDFLC